MKWGSKGTPKPKLEDVAGSLHGRLIADQLAEERLRKTSLEQRALAVITTSGTLATLLVGLATFAAQSKVTLGAAQRALIVGAAGFFALAVVLALTLQYPRKYKEAEMAAMDERTKRARWGSTDLVEEGRLNAVIGYHTIEQAQKVNGSKATWLFRALLAETVAILAAGAAAALTVLGAP